MNEEKEPHLAKEPIIDLEGNLEAELVYHPRYHFLHCPKCATKGGFCENNYSFKCPSCGFHFFLNSAAAVTALIFDNEGKLLVTKRALEPGLGKPDLPGGFIDPNENAETALLRELMEELNIVPNSMTYFGSYPNQYVFSGVTVFTVDLVFHCTITDFDMISPADDITEFSFVNPLDIDIEEIPFKSVRNIITQLQDERRNK
jgi:8-oxo-dGTP pyrophosphatase MutT (NUDIX family)